MKIWTKEKMWWDGIHQNSKLLNLSKNTWGKKASHGMAENICKTNLIKGLYSEHIKRACTSLKTTNIICIYLKGPLSAVLLPVKPAKSYPPCSASLNVNWDHLSGVAVLRPEHGPQQGQWLSWFPHNIS